MAINEMREPSFLLLTALAEGPQHGYALLKRIGDLGDGRHRLKPGSLYTMIDRLVEEGLIEPTGSEVVNGRHRRYYDLTGVGAQELQSRARRMQSNAQQALDGLRDREGDRHATASVGEADVAPGSRQRP